MFLCSNRGEIWVEGVCVGQGVDAVLQGRERRRVKEQRRHRQSHLQPRRPHRVSHRSVCQPQAAWRAIT